MFILPTGSERSPGEHLGPSANTSEQLRFLPRRADHRSGA